MEPVYVTREELSTAIDVKPSAYMSRELDRACRAGSRAAEGLLHRIFYPERKALTFDVSGRRIYFGERALVELEGAEVEGRSVAPSSFILYPGEPPYGWIDWPGSPLGGRVTLTGTWGYLDVDPAVSVLLGALDAASTAVRFDRPADVGAILRIDSERIMVTGRSWSASGVTASLAADKAVTSFAVPDGSVFCEGEALVMDAERLEVQEIVGNTLIVRRATGGSVLAAHTNAAINWQRDHIVQRGALGTTAAAHLSGATVYRWHAPSLVKELAEAYAIDNFLQRNSGYARTIGSGEGERQVSASAIRSIEARAYARYGRKARTAAV